MQEQTERKPSPVLLSGSDLRLYPPGCLRKTDSISEIVYNYLLSGRWSQGSCFVISRTRLIYALPNSQGGEDQIIQHYIDRLKKGPEPLFKGLLPFHISLCLVEKPLEIYLNFLFGGEKVLGQDS